MALLLACGGIASAQQAISTGTITGIVQDEQGLPIPGALVEVTNAQTQEQRSTVSNATGIFNVPALVIGRYKVSVSLTGFGTVERVDIQLQSNEIYNAGMVTLRAGITETLTVTADPIGVQTTTAVRTSVLDTSTIDSLVSRGRDPVRLLNSLPGVDPNIGGLITGGTIGTNLPTMQGTAGFASYVAIDGVGSSDGDTGNNNGITSMDAIQEIRVVMNSYTAEFGRNTGPQINVVTKSGGQRYSGSLSTYIRHEALNSNTLANERLGLPKPIARFYTGVGTIGGPVALPGVGKLKRTFFFYTREMWDTKQAATPEHQADADRGGTHRRFLADDADQRHAVLHPGPAAQRGLQSDRGRPGVLPGQRHSRRSHRPARPRLREPVPGAELLRHQRQQPAVQLRRHRRPERVPDARSGDDRSQLHGQRPGVGQVPALAPESRGDDRDVRHQLQLEPLPRPIRAERGCGHRQLHQDDDQAARERDVVRVSEHAGGRAGRHDARSDREAAARAQRAGCAGLALQHADAQSTQPVSAADVHRCAGDAAQRRVGRAVPHRCHRPALESPEQRDVDGRAASA